MKRFFCCEYPSPVDWLLPHSVRWFRKEVKAGQFRMSRVKDIGAQICSGSNSRIILADTCDICVSLFQDRYFLLKEQAVWQRSFHQKIARSEVTKPDFRWGRPHECPLVVIWERMSRFGKDARRSSIIKMKRWRILATWSAVTGVVHGKIFYARQTCWFSEKVYENPVLHVKHNELRHYSPPPRSWSERFSNSHT